MISHWDEVRSSRGERGHIAGTWQSLTGRTSQTVGVKRIQVDPGMWSTPLHLEGSEEEIFYVVAGSGVSVQSEDEKTEAYEVGVGDCLVHLALEHAHTLQAGPEGLDVLAFGQRHYAANTLLPNAGVSWLGPTWVLAGADEDHPWTREAAVGPPPVGELSLRPDRIVNVADVPLRRSWRKATVASDWRDLGQAAGSLRTGMRHVTVFPGMLHAPPHCHSAEEEIFVALEGSGELELTPTPAADDDAEPSSHPVTAGTTVARPAGTRIAHAFRAGPTGLTLLAYGTRDPNDIAYYPRSGKAFFRGIGLIMQVDSSHYWDGEE